MGPGVIGLAGVENRNRVVYVPLNDKMTGIAVISYSVPYRDTGSEGRQTMARHGAARKGAVQKGAVRTTVTSGIDDLPV
jgi:hypothetical protein